MIAAALRTDFVKVSSLVSTARRLLVEGRSVDLSALQGKVQELCENVADMPLDEGRQLVPEIELLLTNLDGLAVDLDQQFQNHPHPIGSPPPRSTVLRAYGQVADSVLHSQSGFLSDPDGG
ncbi:MAG: hypothetical protein ABT940_10625 [Alphaproteobacteria bacterium]